MTRQFMIGAGGGAFVVYLLCCRPKRCSPCATLEAEDLPREPQRTFAPQAAFQSSSQPAPSPGALNAGDASADQVVVVVSNALTAFEEWRRMAAALQHPARDEWQAMERHLGTSRVTNAQLDGYRRAVQEGRFARDENASALYAMLYVYALLIDGARASNASIDEQFRAVGQLRDRLAREPDTLQEVAARLRTRIPSDIGVTLLAQAPATSPL